VNGQDLCGWVTKRNRFETAGGSKRSIGAKVKGGDASRCGDVVDNGDDFW